MFSLCMTVTELCVSGEVDLVTSSGASSILAHGVISLCNGTERYIICEGGWSYENAKVACKSAGYSPYGNYSYPSLHFAEISINYMFVLV